MRPAVLWIILIVATCSLTAQDNFWTSTKGPYGGNVTEIVSTGSDDVYAATDLGGGVFKSSDNGLNWTGINTGISNRNMLSLLRKPDGDLFAGSDGGGLFRSTDDGKNWTAINAGLINPTIVTILHDEGDVLFVGTSGSGVYRSTDNGDNWEARNTDIDETVVRTLAKNSTGTLFAGTVFQGAFRSTDEGASWNEINFGLSTKWIFVIAVDDDDNLYAGTNRGAFFSENNGNSWEELDNLDERFVRIMAAGEGDVVYAGTDNGIYRSSNKGVDWEAVNSGLSDASISALNIAAGDNLYAGANDEDGFYRSTNGGDSWVQNNKGLQAIPVWSIIKGSSNALFAGSRRYVWKSENDGESWQRSATGLPKRLIWSLFNLGSDLILAGTDAGLYRTNDAGETWTQGTLTDATVYQIVESGTGDLYAAASNGMYRSQDDGDTWQRSGLDGKLLIAATVDSDDNILAGEFFGGIHRSSDNGDSWQAANNGIITTDITSLAANSVGSVFAGTRDAGVYYSTNGGLAWNPLNSGLKDTEILTLAVNSIDDVFAGTFSAGAFRITDPDEDWEDLSSGLAIPTVQSFFMDGVDILYAGTQAGGVFRSANSTNLPSLSVSDDATICAGASTELSVTATAGFPGYSYEWTPDEDLDDPTSAGPTASPDETTEYVVWVTDEAGSRISDTILVTVLPLPAVDLGDDINLCLGSSVQLEASGGVSYSWEPLDGLSCTDCPRPVASPTEDKIYSVTVTGDNGCVATDEISITVLPLPEAQVSENATVCFGESTQLLASGGVEYRWEPTEGLDDAEIPNPLATPEKTTTYTVRVTDANGCSDLAEVQVVVLPAPNARAGDDVQLCIGSEVQLNARGGVGFAWSPPDGLSCTDCPNPIAAPTETTEYSVIVTDANGCTSEDAVLVEVVDLPDFEASAEALDFGSLSECEVSGDENLTLRNNSGYTMTVTDAQFETLDFIVADPPLPFAIEAGAEQVLRLRFAPQASGSFDTEVVIRTAPCDVALAIRLTGEKAASVVQFSPSSLEFSREDLCGDTSPEAEIRINNTGDGNLTLLSSAISDGFIVIEPALPLTLPAGEERVVRVGLDGIPSTAINGELSIPFETEGCNDIIRVTLNSAGTAFEVTASEDVAVCAGESVQLQAQAEGAFRYEWTPAIGLNDPTLPNPLIASADESRVYTVTVWDESGCSGSDEVSVTVSKVNKPTINVEGNELTASEEDVNYQWLFNDVPIENATQRRHSAAETGSYRVIVSTDLGCADTSDAVQVNTVGVRIMRLGQSAFKVYPNPIGNSLRIRATVVTGGAIEVDLRNLLGASVMNTKRQIAAGELRLDLDVGELPPGVYLLQLRQTDSVWTAKVLKE